VEIFSPGFKIVMAHFMTERRGPCDLYCWPQNGMAGLLLLEPCLPNLKFL